MEDRLTELEIKIGFTEDLVEALNRTVFRQQQQIDALVQEIKALRQQVKASPGEEPHSLRDEIPPHY
ncbi:MAG: SlyX protein [Rhodocyclaceae bacterium]|nr:MAG: SlyX protein [Rhodocyclaceae bacterium]